MTSPTYLLDLPSLADAVAMARPGPKHSALVASVCQSVSELSDLRLATTRGDARLAARKVVTAAGELVHDDHQVWLAEQAAADGGDVVATARRLRPLDYRLTECEITTLYLVHDRGGRQQDFVQVTVHQEDEFIERRLFSRHDASWRSLRDVRDLVDEAEDGERFDADAKVRWRPTTYRLVQAIDVASFMEQAGAVEAERRAQQRRRVVMVTDVDPAGGASAPRPVSVGELDPDGAKFAWLGQRLFDDWTYSSAGRAAKRLCDHWVLQTADYTDSAGKRWMSFVPAWTFRPTLAEVARMPASVYELYGKLESIDRRTGVPFGWYFWMLHGNRVHDWAGHRVLAAAEAGQIVLPEHDWRVLRAWSERVYGF